MFTLAPSWATAVHLGGKNAAVFSAAMNSLGQIGGVLSPIALAFLVDRYGNWNLPLLVLSGLYLVAFLCWLVIHPERP
jgi:nitrate/nitrite transporter NarK